MTIYVSVFFVTSLVVCVGIPICCLMGLYDHPELDLFIRLVAADGLDPCAPSVPPVFRLDVDVDGVSEHERSCAGGGDTMLRISYCGMILAWGSMPPFSIDGKQLGWSSAGVVRVEAKVEGSVLREGLRSLILAERQALRRADFDVEGELPGLGHLRCKTFLFERDPTEQLPPCTVQKKEQQ